MMITAKPAARSFHLGSFLVGVFVTFVVVCFQDTSLETDTVVAVLRAACDADHNSNNTSKPWDAISMDRAVQEKPESTQTTANRVSLREAGSFPLPTSSSTDAVGSGTTQTTTTTTTTATARKPTSASSTRSFLQFGRKFGTDKSAGSSALQACLADPSKCHHAEAVNPKCRVLPAHFYDTMYQRWLGPYATETAEPFQFVEVGFFQGHGFDAFSKFLPKAEHHALEIACIPHGPREENKWPWDNFAAVNRNYQKLLDARRLHCGDGNNVTFLNDVWTTHLNRPDAPPLKVVVEDASHWAEHMAQTLFFWFPRLAPGGLLFIEDIEPWSISNRFRTQFLPSIIKDLHYCGLPDEKDSKMCFPTIQPLLKSISCEMHICVFERNDLPAIPDLDEAQSTMPSHALNSSACPG